jgi:schlafen family protein
VSRILDAPEGAKLERKSAAALKDLRVLARATVALLNARGGHVIVGQREDRTIEGIANAERERDRLQQYLLDSIEPPPTSVMGDRRWAPPLEENFVHVRHEVGDFSAIDESPDRHAYAKSKGEPRVLRLAHCASALRTNGFARVGAAAVVLRVRCAAAGRSVDARGARCAPRSARRAPAHSRAVRRYDAAMSRGSKRELAREPPRGAGSVLGCTMSRLIYRRAPIQAM